MNQMATKSVQKGAEGERRGVPLAPPKQFAHIVSVAGSQAVALITRESVQAGAGGNSRVEIGQLVKIVTPHSGVIGIVSAVNLPIPNAVDSSEEFGLIELTLTGEIVTDKVSGRLCFRRGVAMLPTIGDPVLAADRHDLTRVYVQPNSDTIEVGTLYQDELVPARLLIDDLLAKHFIVVGTTGCGKSSAVTCILRRVLADFQHAHIVVLDVHNEYKSVFGQQAEAIDTTSLNLPYWLLNFQELVLALTSTDSHHDAECEILADAIVAAKRQFSELRSIRSDTTAQNITVDTPTPFSFVDVVAWIDEQVGRLERTHVATPYRRLKNRIEALTTDRRYRFMFSGLTIDDNMAEVLGRLFRIPGNGKPITVIDLAAVPGEILDVVISVISRLAFDLAVWSDGRYPMLLVCEEAHRYAPADANGKFLPTRQALARIWRVACPGHAAPVRYRSDHSFTVQYGDRDASVDGARPARRALQCRRQRAEHSRPASLARGPRSHRTGSGCLDADAHTLQRSAKRYRAGFQAPRLFDVVEEREWRLRQPLGNHCPLACQRRHQGLTVSPV
jgi:hypothetical protein